MGSTGIKKSSHSKRHTDFIDVLGDHPVYMKSGVVFSALDLLRTASFRLGEVSGGWRTTLNDLLNVKVVVGNSGWVTARGVIEQVALSDLPSYSKSDRYARLVVNSNPHAPTVGSQVKTDEERIQEFFESFDMAFAEAAATGDPFLRELPRVDEVVRYELSKVTENAYGLEGAKRTETRVLTDPIDVALIDRVVERYNVDCDICGEEH